MITFLSNKKKLHIKWYPNGMECKIKKNRLELKTKCNAKHTNQYLAKHSQF